MDTLLVALAIPLGLAAGGFATMLVDRVPDSTSLSWRSRCPACEGRLPHRDTIPLVGWLIRRGRCRHCGAAITPAYPAVELVTAALTLTVVLRYDDAGWSILLPLILVVALVALSTIDLYVYRLPDAIVFPALGLSLMVMVAVAIFDLDRPRAIGTALAGAVAYFALLFILHIINPQGMGFGDVKLALLLGLHSGWVAGAFYRGWIPVFRLTFWAMLLGVLMGLILSLVILGLRRFVDRGVLPDPEAEGDETTPVRKLAVPFGPGLALGTLIVVLFPDLVLG